MIRTMMNSAVHFGGGIVLGVLTIFALKGMADMNDTRMSRDPRRLGRHASAAGLKCWTWLRQGRGNLSEVRFDEDQSRRTGWLFEAHRDRGVTG